MTIFGKSVFSGLIAAAMACGLACGTAAVAVAQSAGGGSVAHSQRTKGAASSAEAPVAAANGKWTPEDVVNQEDAGAFDISKDGRWAVWVKTTSDKEKNERVGNLFVSSLSERREVQLTRGADQVSQPHWSPSGNLIGFLSTRALPKPNPKADSTQLWLIDASGGEAWPVTESERGIQQFEWINEDTILFSAEENPTLYDSKIKDEKDDSNVVDDTAHAAPVRLFELSIKDKKVRRITDNTDWILSFAVSRDKTKVAMSAGRELSYSWDQKTPPVSYVVSLQTGERTQILGTNTSCRARSCGRGTIRDFMSWRRIRAIRNS